MPQKSQIIFHLFSAVFRLIKATSLLGLKPAETMMVAAHKGDLSAAHTTGMRTAYIKVPEEDNVDEGFGKPSENITFDVQASDFEALCKDLQV